MSAIDDAVTPQGHDGVHVLLGSGLCGSFHLPAAAAHVGEPAPSDRGHSRYFSGPNSGLTPSSWASHGMGATSLRGTSSGSVTRTWGGFRSHSAIYLALFGNQGVVYL